MALTFTKQRGERGRRALMNGFMYTCQRKSENGKSSQWMCVKNKQLSCKGRLKISYNEDRADETGAHNHMPNVAECKASMATASVNPIPVRGGGPNRPPPLIVFLCCSFVSGDNDLKLCDFS